MPCSDRTHGEVCGGVSILAGRYNNKNRFTRDDDVFCALGCSQRR